VGVRHRQIPTSYLTPIQSTNLGKELGFGASIPDDASGTPMLEGITPQERMQVLKICPYQAGSYDFILLEVSSDRIRQAIVQIDKPSKGATLREMTLEQFGVAVKKAIDWDPDQRVNQRDRYQERSRQRASSV